MRKSLNCIERFRNARAAIGLAIVCALGASTGCGNSGPKLGTVAGTVKLDGKPLEGAIVTFNPSTGRGSRGLTGSDGAYQLKYVGNQKGALVGEHSVTITTKWMDEDAATGKMVQHSEAVPPKYNAQSTIKKTVESGRNTFDFDLASK